jgi:hypothetical protein
MLARIVESIGGQEESVGDMFVCSAVPVGCGMVVPVAVGCAGVADGRASVGAQAPRVKANEIRRNEARHRLKLVLSMLPILSSAHEEM